MVDINREISELLVDYAGTLRDGCIPTFLKSLTRSEAKRIASSPEFWEATEMVRVLNSVGFADRAVPPDVGLFISRVDAEITSRLKQTHLSPRARHTKHARREKYTEPETDRSL